MTRLRAFAPTASGTPALRRFILFVLIALLAVAPAMGLRLTGWRPDPVADALLFGVAVLAALDAQ